MRPPPRKLRYEDIGQNPDCANVRIFLDGIEQKACMSYDMDKGEITRYKDMSDWFETVTDQYSWERLEGVVTVEWIDPSTVLPQPYQ